MDKLGLDAKKLAVVAAVSGAAICAVRFIRFLADNPVPKKNIDKRAEAVSRFFVDDVKGMYTFDQLFSGFDLLEARSDGFVRGTITAAGPLLSKDGKLHEGGLMCLIDDLTSLAVLLKAIWPGVTVEMSFSSLDSVLAGEQLVIEAQVLRIGSTVAFTSFEMRRNEELVAVGGQTKHIGLPFSQRAMAGFMSHVLQYSPSSMMAWGQRKRDDFLQKLVEGGKVPQLEQIPGDSRMEEVLELQEFQQHVRRHGSTFSVAMKLSLLNGYLGGHGAASAALTAAAVRAHLHVKGVQMVRISDMRCVYMTPVPAFKIANVVLDPLPVSSSSKLHHFVVDVCNDKGQKCVRSHVAVELL